MPYLNHRRWRCYRLPRWSHKTNCSNSLQRQEALKQELAAKKTALQEAQRRQRQTLTRQIRRAKARLSAADRKRRTRRLILIGSYIDRVSQADPECPCRRLIKGLDEFLERDQDRALFNLAPWGEIQNERSGYRGFQGFLATPTALAEFLVRDAIQLESMDEPRYRNGLVRAC